MLKVVIIGGVAGGASCATKLRREDNNIKINLYENNTFRCLEEINRVGEVLISTFQKVNLQAKCVFFKDRINQLKQNTKIKTRYRQCLRVVSRKSRTTKCGKFCNRWY